LSCVLLLLHSRSSVASLSLLSLLSSFLSFLFNRPSTTDIYPLSLHDALPIYVDSLVQHACRYEGPERPLAESHEHLFALSSTDVDRKSTRLNSSHGSISYAVFCLKKKKQNENIKYAK